MPLELRVASPCHESWDSMCGDARSRFCSRCQLSVFDLRHLSEGEIRSLVSSEGRFCGRLYTRPDGTALTRDCPTGVRASRLKLARGFSAALALLFGLAAGSRALTLRAQDPRSEPEVPLVARMTERLVSLREFLRSTETFGALVDRLSPPPPPPRFTMGIIRGTSTKPSKP